MEIQEIVVWCIIGLLAGNLAGAVINQKKEGFGFVTNLIFGLIGAFIGGAIFQKAEINLGLQAITIDLNQVVAAFAGSILVVIAAKFIEGRRQKSEKK